jgi:hypothetical protein
MSIWNQELTASLHELNAKASQRRGDEKRKAVAQMNADADVIEKNIAEVDQKYADGFWECECGRENTQAPAVPQDEGHVISCECGKPMKLISRARTTPQERYEADKEKGEAQKIAASKRQEAAALEEAITVHTDTATQFMKQAAQCREHADLLRKL